MLTTVQTRNHAWHMLLVTWWLLAVVCSAGTDDFWVYRGLFLACLFCPLELGRIGALGNGGEYVSGLSQLQERENCIAYPIGTSEEIVVINLFWEHLPGSPVEASFEAEPLPLTRYCQLMYSITRCRPCYMCLLRPPHC